MEGGLINFVWTYKWLTYVHVDEEHGRDIDGLDTIKEINKKYRVFHNHCKKRSPP